MSYANEPLTTPNNPLLARVMSDLIPEGGLSLDLEPADKEPKNQNWLF